VREKLTGQTPPASAGKVLDLWRDFIVDKAAKPTWTASLPP
jgi:cobaltochelatase CobT